MPGPSRWLQVYGWLDRWLWAQEKCGVYGVIRWLSNSPARWMRALGDLVFVVVWRWTGWLVSVHLWYIHRIDRAEGH